jgi:hypothetical protein
MKRVLREASLSALLVRIPNHEHHGRENLHSLREYTNCHKQIEGKNEEVRCASGKVSELNVKYVTV